MLFVDETVLIDDSIIRLSSKLRKTRETKGFKTSRRKFAYM